MVNKRHWKDQNNGKPKKELDLSELRKSMVSSALVVPKKPIVIDPMDKHRERIKELRQRLEELIKKNELVD